MNLKPLILNELGVFCCLGTRTKIQFIYLNNFKKLMTDAVYTALKPKDKEYRESDVQGLYMRITPKDAKSWQY
jgi:hypothetical protein